MRGPDTDLLHAIVDARAGRISRGYPKPSAGTARHPAVIGLVAAANQRIASVGVVEFGCFARKFVAPVAGNALAHERIPVLRAPLPALGPVSTVED